MRRCESLLLCRLKRVLLILVESPRGSVADQLLFQSAADSWRISFPTVILVAITNARQSNGANALFGSPSQSDRFVYLLLTGSLFVSK